MGCKGAQKIGCTALTCVTTCSIRNGGGLGGNTERSVGHCASECLAFCFCTPSPSDLATLSRTSLSIASVPHHRMTQSHRRPPGPPCPWEPLGGPACRKWDAWSTYHQGVGKGGLSTNTRAIRQLVRSRKARNHQTLRESSLGARPGSVLAGPIPRCPATPYPIPAPMHPHPVLPTHPAAPSSSFEGT